MTYSFDASLADDVSLVRFHIGDNSSEGHFLEDETIQYFVTAGSVGSAVVECIKYIITQLSKPDFRLDWMAVSNMAAAREGYEKLLTKKASEFGIPLYTASSTISVPYRADSLQDSDEAVYDGTTL
jgi:hypothetical protein